MTVLELELFGCLILTLMGQIVEICKDLLQKGSWLFLVLEMWIQWCCLGAGVVAKPIPSWEHKGDTEWPTGDSHLWHCRDCLGHVATAPCPAHRLR